MLDSLVFTIFLTQKMKVFWVKLSSEAKRVAFWTKKNKTWRSAQSGKCREKMTRNIKKKRKWQRRENPEPQHIKSKHALSQTPTIRPRLLSGFAPTAFQTSSRVFLGCVFFFFLSWTHFLEIHISRMWCPQEKWSTGPRGLIEEVGG